MRYDEFWHIINMLDDNQNNNPQGVMRFAVDELARRGLDEIHSFDEILTELLYRIDGRRWAVEIGKKYFHPNDTFDEANFLAVRCCVIANGEEFYKLVVDRPKQIPKDQVFSELLDIVPFAFSKCTQQPAGSYRYATRLSKNTYSNHWSWRDTQSGGELALRKMSIFPILLAILPAVGFGWMVIKAVHTAILCVRGKPLIKDALTASAFAFGLFVVVAVEFAIFRWRKTFLFLSQTTWCVILIAAITVGAGGYLWLILN